METRSQTLQTVPPDPGLSRAPSAGPRGGLARDALVPGTLVGGLVLGLCVAQGGYFPPSWGWAALFALWVVGILLLTGTPIVADRLEIGFLLALGTLAGWVGVSALWSESPSRSVLEFERSLVYLAGPAAVLFVARRRSLVYVFGGLLAAVTLTVGYGLATRLFPDRLGVFDSVAVYRLAEPLGYWNALAVLAAMGTLLALGVAAHAPHPAARAAAGPALVILLSAFYFTFSRAGWVALAIGVAAVVALDPRRLRLITTGLVLLPVLALAVLLSARSPALTRRYSAIEATAAEGQRLALYLALLGFLASALLLVFAAVEARVRIPRWLTRAYAAVLLLALIAGLTAVFTRLGTPDVLARKAHAAFVSPPPRVDVDLNTRLFSFSGNGRAELWQIAWEQYRSNPLLGAGAGTYERYWVSHPRSTFKVRDAHGLYVETLAELGPVGLGLLVVALGLPLAAVARNRAWSLAPAAGGAYVTYLAHAGVDWDWEMSGVTLAALVCGCLALIAARPDDARFLTARARLVLLAGLVPVAAVAMVGLLGNSALRTSSEAIAAGDWQDAERAARRAQTWMPWSPQPWVVLGESQLGAGDLSGAKASFEHAIEKDRAEWKAWLGLGLATRGADRRHALERASQLNRHQRGLSELLAGTARPTG